MKLELTDDEIISLDGKCESDTQIIVEQIKFSMTLRESGGITAKQSHMIAKILHVAKEKGRLTYQRTGIRYCPCCNDSAGYAKYKRNSINHQKGDENRNKPLYLGAFNLDQGFIVIANHISTGYCDNCKQTMEPVLIKLLKGIKTQIPSHWEDAPHDYLKYDNKICSKCAWEGHEGEMKKLNALMGGKYPGGCPNCEARNEVFGAQNIRLSEGFTIVEIKGEEK